MQVIGILLIDEFKKRHASSRKALDRWLKLVETVDFNSHHDIKLLFGANVDFVGSQIVFDVGGNKVRTITKVQYGVKVILITHVLTHVEYDKNKWKE